MLAGIVPALAELTFLSSRHYVVLGKLRMSWLISWSAWTGLVSESRSTKR